MHTQQIKNHQPVAEQDYAVTTMAPDARLVQANGASRRQARLSRWKRSLLVFLGLPIVYALWAGAGVGATLAQLLDQPLLPLLLIGTGVVLRLRSR